MLDARRCLSYLSQSRLDELPHAEAFEDRVYGCDICQDVCPWNTGPNGGRRPSIRTRSTTRSRRCATWLEADPAELAHRYRRLYVPDRDGPHLQRNARVALANVSGSRPASAG